MYDISIQKTFAAAHALRLLDDDLEPLHGHNWQVTLSVCGERLDAIETLMDFHDLERILARVVEPFHNRNLNEVEPFVRTYNPTAERVAWWIGTQVQPHLPAGVSLRYVSVTEAPGCVATWWPANGESR